MRTRLLAVAAASLLVLSGCGGNPEPKTLPSESASPSTSASASASPPVLPDGVRANNRAGSEAAVRYFIDALNYSGNAGDTTSLRAGFVASCTRCESLADSIDKTYSDGGYYKGGDWSITRLKFFAIRDGVAYIDATVDYEAQEWLKVSGAEPTKFDATKNQLHAFQLKYSKAQGWRVGALDPNR